MTNTTWKCLLTVVKSRIDFSIGFVYFLRAYSYAKADVSSSAFLIVELEFRVVGNATLQYLGALCFKNREDFVGALGKKLRSKRR